MGKDAISTTKKESPPSNSSGGSNGSPIIFIIAIIALVTIGLIFFKDKLFKNKTKNLTDLAEPKFEEKPKAEEEEPKPEPEVLQDKEKTDVEKKFADLN